MNDCFWCEAPVSDGICTHCAAHQPAAHTTMGEGAVKVTGSISIDGSEARTVGEVREWLEACEMYGISDDTVLEDFLFVYVNGVKVTPSQCGEHPAGEYPIDALVELHRCTP